MVGDTGLNPRTHEPFLAPEQLAASVLEKDDWELVDDMMRFVAEDPLYQDWARGHLNDDEISLRDLAATIYGNSTVDIDDEVRNSLHLGMTDDDDPFVRFRSACALAQHGERSDEAKAVIEAGRHHEDTVKPAEKYLRLWDENPDA